MDISYIHLTFVQQVEFLHESRYTLALTSHENIESVFTHLAMWLEHCELLSTSSQTPLNIYKMDNNILCMLHHSTNIVVKIYLLY